MYDVVNPARAALHGSVAHDAARERTTLMKLMSTPAVAILATLFLPWHGTFVVAQQQATAQAPQSSQRARPSPDAARFPRSQNRVGVLLSRMTLDEKLGQMSQAAIRPRSTTG